MKLGFDPHLPVSRAVTPPATWYTSNEFAKLEEESVFLNSWQPVGQVQSLTKAGDFFAGEFLGRPYVVVKSEDGEIRAFYNVCRHHAAELVTGQGCIKRFSCPYHGWNYSLSGDLLAAPRMQGAENFEKSQFALIPIETEITGPLIWLKFGTPNGSGPQQRFEGVWQRLEQSGYTGLRFHSRRSYDMACNWKVYVDNYLDGGYHVGILHRGLTGQLDLAAYRTEVQPEYSLQMCGGRGDPRIGEEAFYAWMYPNFMINRYGPVMDTNWVIPLGPERCRTVFDFYFSPDLGETSEKFIAESLAMSEKVQQEDVMISESVQRGLRSGAYEVGRYAPQVEHAMHAFHLRLDQDLRRQK